MSKNLVRMKKVLNFAPVERREIQYNNHLKLPCGVMVARRILVPPVRVRILPRQLLKIAVS